jgi:hypothetical protein
VCRQIPPGAPQRDTRNDELAGIDTSRVLSPCDPVDKSGALSSGRANLGK